MQVWLWEFGFNSTECKKTKQRKNLPSDSTNHHCKLKHLRFSKASFFHEVSWFISHHDSKNEGDQPSLLVSHKIKRECQDWTSYYTVSKLNVQEIKCLYFSATQWLWMFDPLATTKMNHPSNRLSIVCWFSGFGLWGKHYKQRSPDFPFPSHVFQLIRVGTPIGVPKQAKRYNLASGSSDCAVGSLQ